MPPYRWKEINFLRQHCYPSQAVLLVNYSFSSFFCRICWQHWGRQRPGCQGSRTVEDSSACGQVLTWCCVCVHCAANCQTASNWGSFKGRACVSSRLLMDLFTLPDTERMLATDRQRMQFVCTTDESSTERLCDERK